jgi:hypothetical protein
LFGVADPENLEPSERFSRVAQISLSLHTEVCCRPASSSLTRRQSEF